MVLIEAASAMLEPIQVAISSSKETPGLLTTLSAYAWPLVTIVSLLIFRKPIKEFLKTVSSRATEFGIGWASIKLPEVKPPSSMQIEAIRELQSDLWSESSVGWFQEFSSSSANSEYAHLNLGKGDEWITSRLFIFAVMLQRMKSLKCVVFTKVFPSGDVRFLGCASPDNIHLTLAANQPWLEVAFADAYSAELSALPAASPGQTVIRIDGSLEPQRAESIVRSFISSLKDYTGAMSNSNPGDWVSFVGRTDREHATWVTESELQRMIGIYLWRDAIEARVDDTVGQKKAEIQRVVSKSSPYVAVLRDGFYKSLVNRIALLTEIGQSAL
jgi:hypothetical protein